MPILSQAKIALLKNHEKICKQYREIMHLPISHKTRTTLNKKLELSARLCSIAFNTESLQNTAWTDEEINNALRTLNL